MLSILIPTYNYPTLSLVNELFTQVSKLGLNFEILVLDDASDNLEIVKENLKINLIENCKYIVNPENLGRALNRNKLVSISKYENLLFMDCDTFPKDSLFLERYANFVKKSTEKVVFGGIDYQTERPKNDEMLRWIYGKKRERIALEIRLKNPYNYVLTSNILIKKYVMEQFPFPDYITAYGFEDVVLILKLKENHIPIAHIDNPSVHLNLEKSLVFIEKYHSSLTNLKFLIESNKISVSDSKLATLYYKIKRFNLVSILLWIFEKTEKNIIKNLTSDKPRLALFDFYKLGYFAKLYSKQ